MDVKSSLYVFRSRSLSCACPIENAFTRLTVRVCVWGCAGWGTESFATRAAPVVPRVSTGVVACMATCGGWSVCAGRARAARNTLHLALRVVPHDLGVVVQFFGIVLAVERSELDVEHIVRIIAIARGGECLCQRDCRVSLPILQRWRRRHLSHASCARSYVTNRVEGAAEGNRQADY